MSVRWIKVAYLDNVDHPYVVETLPCDETLLNELFNSAKEFIEEFQRRMAKLRLPPPIALQIHSELTSAAISLHGVALETVANSEFRQQPHSYHKVHCGYVRIDWIDSPTEEQKQLAQTVVETSIRERFWFLSSFRMTLI